MFNIFHVIFSNDGWSLRILLIEAVGLWFYACCHGFIAIVCKSFSLLNCCYFCWGLGEGMSCYSIMVLFVKCALQKSPNLLYDV